MALDAPSPTSSPAATEPLPPFQPRRDQVLVRMYGQGLGDCFLLAFPRVVTNGARAKRPVYVLIDCGVLSGTPGSSRRMATIVEDIRRTTGGHLDLLVITHEHWDHLSGFIYADARKAWRGMQVDAVWTGWTANREGDDLAGVLQQIKDLEQQALAEIERQAVRLGLDQRLSTALGLNNFLADKEDAPGRTLASGLSFVLDELGQRERVVYCEPGEVRPVPGTESVAYVLGPPRQWQFLSRMNPSSSAPETYENPFALRADVPDDPVLAGREQLRALRRLLAEPSTLNAFVTALHVQGRGADDHGNGIAPQSKEPPSDAFERSLPFDRSFRIPLAIAEAEAVNAPATYPVLASYFDSINAWRRIDTDWLLSANTFALAADNFVNNTSLVLAFELPPATPWARRNILLFVADAQVGNWLSWETIPAWTPRDGARPAQNVTKPDIDDLLRRTVLYKVGHHGSHNATLKEKGVEKMTADGSLTALVPVSPAVATNVGWSEMPLRTLLDTLAERTGGRVVLPGGLWPPDSSGVLRPHDAIDVRASCQMLEAKHRGDDGELLEGEVPLWTEITIDYAQGVRA